MKDFIEFCKFALCMGVFMPVGYLAGWLFRSEDVCYAIILVGAIILFVKLKNHESFKKREKGNSMNSESYTKESFIDNEKEEIKEYYDQQYGMYNATRQKEWREQGRQMAKGIQEEMNKYR